MSKKDSTLSKDQQNLLKQFRKQISIPQSSPEAKQTEVQSARDDKDSGEDLDLFKKALQGVQPLQGSNIAQVEKTRKFKPNAQILAKRAAAEGPREVELAELSDTQAELNPVGSQSKLSYRIAA